VFLAGINHPDAATDPLFIAGAALPWLQDVPVDGAWQLWQVRLRDVYVLDTEDRLVGTYNLTDHDLALEAHRDELLDMIESAAEGAADE